MTPAEVLRTLKILTEVARIFAIPIKMMLDAARQVEPELRNERLPEEDDAMGEARADALERAKLRDDTDE